MRTARANLRRKTAREKKEDCVYHHTRTAQDDHDAP